MTVQYPYALGSDGNPVNIGSAFRGNPFTCLGCGRAMVAKKGRKRQAHFAHNPPHSDGCDPDTALHQMAQALVLAHFDDALAKGRPYLLGRSCRDCNAILSRNIAVEGSYIKPEQELVEGTRTDVVVCFLHEPPVALEIIVTHDLEDDTRAKYEDSGISVFLKYFASFDDLTGLHTQFVADDSINENLTCSDCSNRRRAAEVERRNREKARAKTFARRKATIDKSVGRIIRKPSGRVLFNPWYCGKPDLWGQPVPMYPKTQQPVFANAIILTESGLMQSNSKKPWLFSFAVAPNVRVYADLGGSEVVPIYEDTAAMLYAFGPGLGQESEDDHLTEQYLIDAIGSKLQALGCSVRTGFESPIHIERQDVDPLLHVRLDILRDLIRYELPRR